MRRSSVLDNFKPVNAPKFWVHYQAIFLKLEYFEVIPYYSMQNAIECLYK